MSWATYLYSPIVFNRKTYNCIGAVKSDYHEVNQLIKGYEDDLLALGLMTEPQKFCSEDSDPMTYIQTKVRTCLEELDELYVERAKLSVLLEDWDKCHDKEGYAIKPPQSFAYDEAYLEGDYIKHGKEDEDSEIL